MTLANKTEVGCTPLLHETIFAIQFRNGTAMIIGKWQSERIRRLSVNFVVLGYDVQLFADQRSILRAVSPRSVGVINVSLVSRRGVIMWYCHYNGDTAASSVTICTRANDQSRNCIILTQFPSQLLMMQRSGLCWWWNNTIRLLPTAGPNTWPLCFHRSGK